MFDPMNTLECVLCSRTYPLDIFNPFCPTCGNPLLFPLAAGKKKIYVDKDFSLDRYCEILPLKEINTDLFLGEGNTPLVVLKRIQEKFDLPYVLAKNETINPTYSFKDRGTAAAVQKAVSLGISRIGTVSTGNMASSTAAYGTKAGLQTFILVKEDISEEKLLATSVYDPFIIKVKGHYGELYRKSFEIGKKHNIYFMNSTDPFRIEGYKITAWELYHQLNNQAPDYIFVPVSAGGHIIGLMKGFQEMMDQGFISRFPFFVGVQAHGCSPLVQAFNAGSDCYEKLKNTHTIAQSISNPDPPGGNIVLKWIRKYRNTLIDVTDAEILSACKFLSGYEGIFALPASAAALAGLLKFNSQKKIDPNKQAVLIITGSGLKSMQSLSSVKNRHYNSTLDKLDHIFQVQLTPSS